MNTLSIEHEEGYAAFKEAEATLERMARTLIPANADLQQLMQMLASADPTGAVESRDALSDSERELKKAEARYRALVEQIPAVSFMAPLDGTVSELYVSPQIEQLLGFTAEEWLSNPILWYAQLHPQDQERWQGEFARTLNAGEHFRSDYRFISKDGRIVWVHGEARVVSDEYGRPLFLQGVAYDITETKEAEEKLRKVNTRLATARDQALEASRAKSAFLANMSHELRTPLNAIMGFTEMLTEDAELSGQDSFLPDLRTIHGSAKHLLGLINGILDLSKIEAGRMSLFLETFDLDAMIQETLGTVLPLVEANGNALVLSGKNLGSIHADAPKVKQILLNLISNAAKFTENGTITLEAARYIDREGEWVKLSIKDTGIGIPPEKLRQLFQAFSQGDDSTTRKYGGTGLGLVISQRFCEMMGGSISVSSEANKGSTFTVRLPVEVTPQVLSEETPEQATEATKVAPDERAHVLVIDDDGHMRDSISEFLSKENMRVTTAGTAAEGLRLARDLLPSAILLDISLPDQDGWNVLTTLKNDPTLADTPVVLFTAADDTRCHTVSTADFLTKPIDWSALSGVLQKYRGDTTAPGRLLIVDDDPTNRELLRRMVSGEGWTISEADNGVTALQAVAEQTPDLILLDLMMPQVDGFEVLRLLRKSQTASSIPVVVVTAKELTAEDRARLDGSVQRIIQKGSYSRDEMLTQARTLVTASILARSVKPRTETKSTPATTPRETTPQPVADAGWAEREAELKADAETAKQQLRDQQQTVELLKEEFAEVYANLESMRELEQQVERLRAERDAAVTEAQRLAERNAADREARAAKALRKRRRQIEKSISSQSDVPTALAEVGTTENKPLPADTWHFVIQDAQKQTRCGRVLGAELREWIKMGRLSGTTQVLLSRKPDGPYEPLSSFAEFKNEAPKAAPLTQTPPPATHTESDLWFVVIEDRQGQTRRGKATAQDIHGWIQNGRLAGAAKVLLSRRADGPYVPLGDVSEFAPAAKAKEIGRTPTPTPTPARISPTTLTQVAATTPTAEAPASKKNWLIVGSLIALAAIVGLVAGALLK